ncbi:unnamed protein product [Cyclocybe aegerita]|uniref:Uncharacterized protein n=1 Tax=Cyclocybe aegerita TaxID=1973307 RepID=A0A8S0WH89_CYCAE|nr:unnamed protein product [Cyclocybe aegerita]
MNAISAWGTALHRCGLHSPLAILAMLTLTLCWSCLGLCGGDPARARAIVIIVVLDVLSPSLCRPHPHHAAMLPSSSSLSSCHPRPHHRTVVLVVVLPSLSSLCCPHSPPSCPPQHRTILILAPSSPLCRGGQADISRNGSNMRAVSDLGTSCVACTSYMVVFTVTAVESMAPSSSTLCHRAFLALVALVSATQPSCSLWKGGADLVVAHPQAVMVVRFALYATRVLAVFLPLCDAWMEGSQKA